MHCLSRMNGLLVLLWRSSRCLITKATNLLLGCYLSLVIFGGDELLDALEIS